jgi:hypothetical protein
MCVVRLRMTLLGTSLVQACTYGPEQQCATIDQVVRRSPSAPGSQDSKATARCTSGSAGVGEVAAGATS